MNSYNIKELMKISGQNWDEIIEQHIERRKKHMSEGGKCFFDSDGQEIWIDKETNEDLADFNLKHITDPKRFN